MTDRINEDRAYSVNNSRKYMKRTKLYDTDGTESGGESIDLSIKYDYNERGYPDIGQYDCD